MANGRCFVLCLLTLSLSGCDDATPSNTGIVGSNVQAADPTQDSERASTDGRRSGLQAPSPLSSVEQPAQPAQSPQPYSWVESCPVPTTEEWVPRALPTGTVEDFHAYLGTSHYELCVVQSAPHRARSEARRQRALAFDAVLRSLRVRAWAASQPSRPKKRG
jgi:hypothetical protein